MVSQVLHTVCCFISGEAAGESWYWWLWGLKGLMTVIGKQPFERSGSKGRKANTLQFQGRASHNKPSELTPLRFAGYLRLGCMARDRGQIYEVSDWFKEALQVNQVLSPHCYSRTNFTPENERERQGYLEDFEPTVHNLTLDPKGWLYCLIEKRSEANARAIQTDSITRHFVPVRRTTSTPGPSSATSTWRIKNGVRARRSSS